MRRTKIVVTIGPSSRDPQTIKSLIEAGVNVFRLNFSHGDQNYHRENIEKIRKISQELNIPVAILQDLSGPKIRIGEVKTPFTLHQGEILEIYKRPITCEKIDGIGKVYIDFPEILDDLKEGDLIYIADGLIKVKLIKKELEKIVTQVIQGGVISSKKGVNFPGAHLSISALTEKDKKDLEFGLKMEVDLIALSFVNTPKDIIECKKLVEKYQKKTFILAKIETQKGVENFDEILKVVDGIMIARGDLGVEIPIERVPVIQKELVRKCKEKGKPVIIATQMLTSMINSTMPSRADISDIANAVLDGADALMLSDETTVGKYPVEAVKMMAKTIEEAEKIYFFGPEECQHVSPDFAIAYSSCILAEEIGAKIIVVFTKSGSSAMRVAKFRPKALILANVHNEEVLRRLNLVWGVYPYMVLSESNNVENMVKEFVKKAFNDKIISEEDTLVLTMGYPIGKIGSTNLIRVIKNDQLKEILSQ
ncbi:pyruvate kinase [Thermodesulfobacterium hydrogeniphilum]|uniref:pyruvate kinase n=1 Tax=Thermodesulfobacterium hydrogeniphilum TaxID=161156 RepID=UPI00056FB656|nr:pyruvate kinase [Thermodesulfobacterium hydrogeniphilum]